MLKMLVVPRLDVCSTAEEAHPAVEGHRILKVGLVKMTIFRGTGSFVDILVLLVGFQAEVESQLSEE
jgi:hypothetical protein